MTVAEEPPPTGSAKNDPEDANTNDVNITKANADGEGPPPTSSVIPKDGGNTNEANTNEENKDMPAKNNITANKDGKDLPAIDILTGKKDVNPSDAPTKSAKVFKPVMPTREDTLSYDLKNLAAFDIGPLQAEDDLMAYTRDNVQFLINTLFRLPAQNTEEGPAAQLPLKSTGGLPRGMPVPRPKAKTRWAQFMEARNMKKRKRSYRVWDETTGEWKRRYGYDSIKSAQREADWIREVGKGDDPNRDPFEEEETERKLHTARQKMREVRNKVEASGSKLKVAAPELDGGGVKSGRGVPGLKEALKRAQASSASFGKFDRVAKNEPTNLQPKIRKVPLRTGAEEKNRDMKLASRVLSSEGKIDTSKAKHFTEDLLTSRKKKPSKVKNRKAGVKTTGRKYRKKR